MLRKTFAVFGVLAAMSSCTPVYAQVSPLTESNCKVIKTMARQILIDIQQGASQYQIMQQLNNRKIEEFGKDGEVVKLYLQVNTSAFTRNMRRGYRVQQVLNAVERDCVEQIGKDL